MPIPALIAPALVSIGVKLAGKALKSLLKPTDSAAADTKAPQVSAESFDQLLKTQQTLTAAATQVAPPVAPPMELLPPSDLIARLGHDQGVRSLALGLQTRLRIPGTPAAAGNDSHHFSLAGRLAGKLRLDSLA